MLPKLKVLFLCTGNSCRSQMAEGWARKLFGERLEAYSAGTMPGRVDPRAILVMREAGIDISGHRSNHFDEFMGIDVDAVVTVCDSAKEACPVFPGNVHRIHVDFDDPPRLAASAASEEEALGPYRRVRDEIRVFLEGLPDTLDTLTARIPGAGGTLR